MNHDKKIVGVFHSEQEAIRTVQDLKRQGYSADQISVVAKDRDHMDHISDETGTKAPEGVATGAATGGMLGGISGILLGMGALAIPGIGPIIAAGPIVAGLTGAAIGAGTGGLVGGLIGLGIPEDEAHMYNDHVRDGNILVMVDSNSDLEDDAHDTFRANNSLNSKFYDRDFNSEFDGERDRDTYR